MAEAIGQIRVEASIGTAKYVEGAKKIKAETASLERDVKTRFSGIGAAVKGGIAGLVGALSVGAFVQIGRAALDYAAKLGDVSQQLGVTTKDLQTLRYAAGQLGVSQSELEKGLENLTKSLGRVAVGAEKPAKALEAIGLNAQAIARMDTGDAFRAIADALSKVTDRAQRAAVETALFGEAGAKLDTMLAGGSGALNELADAADRLGIVLSDEQIQKADETADKLDALKTVLMARIAGVVADNADSILSFADSLQYLVGKAAQAIEWLGRLRAALATGAGRNALPEILLGRTVGGDPVPQTGQQRFSGLFKGRPAAPRGVDVGDFLAKAPRAPRTRRTRTPRDDSARDLHRFEQDELRAQQDILRAKQQLATDIVDRTTLGVQILDLERESYKHGLDFQVAEKDLTAAQRDRLMLLYDQKDALERQSLLHEEQEQRQRETVRLAGVDLDTQRDALEAQLQLAETQSERRVIELRLLDNAYERERLAIAELEASQEFADQEEARRRKASLNATYAADKQGVKNRTRGPWEDYMSSLPTSTEKWNEALEEVAANGLQSVEDGIVDILTGTKSVGDALRSIVRDLLGDLIRLGVRRMFGAILTGGFAEGGYTGNVPVGQPAGVVHGQEYVINAKATKQFLPLLEAINQGKELGMAGGGFAGRIALPTVNHAQRIGVSNDNPAPGPTFGDMHFNFPGITNAREARIATLHAANALRSAVARSTRANG